MDIQQRQESEQYYSEGELWQLSRAIFDGLSFLQTNGVSHGDICTQTVYLDSGVIPQRWLVADQGFFSNNMTGYMKVLSGKSNFAFLSPNELEGLKNHKYNVQHNCHKSDTFSVGMVLLQASTLKSSKSCYDFQNFRVSNDDIESRLGELRQRYTPPYIQFLRMCFIPNETHRLDPTQTFQSSYLMAEPVPMYSDSPARVAQKLQYSQQCQGLPQVQEQQSSKGGSCSDVIELKEESQVPQVQEQQLIVQVGQKQDEVQLVHPQSTIPQSRLPQIVPNITQAPYQPKFQTAYQPYVPVYSNYRYQNNYNASSNYGHYSQVYNQLSKSQAPQLHVLQQTDTNAMIQPGVPQPVSALTQSQHKIPSREEMNAIMDAYNQKYKDSSLVNTFVLNKPKVDLAPVKYTYNYHGDGPRHLETKQVTTHVQPLKPFVPVPQQEENQTSTDPANYVPNSYFYNKYLQELQDKQEAEKSCQQQPTVEFVTSQDVIIQSSEAQPQVEQNVQVIEPMQSVTGVQQNNTEHYKDGSIYQGQILNKLRHGKGVFSYADGGVYDGEWKFGAMDGFGKLYYPNEKLAYEGQWKNNAFNGKGIVYNEDPLPLEGAFDYNNFDLVSEVWVKYEGEFLQDSKNGVGTLVLNNGEKYIGQFEKDMIHGHGAFYMLNGEMKKGKWKRNIFHKEE